MRIIKLLLVILISTPSLQGQFKTKLQPGSIQDLPINERIDLSKISPKNETTKDDGFRLDAFSPLSMDIIGESQFRILKKDDNDVVTWLKGIVNTEKSDSWETKANKWIAEAAETLGTDSESNKFRIHEIWSDELGQNHIRMHQFHNGIKVYGAEVILHGVNDRISLQNGNYQRSKSLPADVEINLSENNVKEIIIKELDNYHEDFNKLKSLGIATDLERWKIEKVFYKYDNHIHLVYHASVYPNLGEHFEYFVDANTGDIINHYSTICTAHNHNHSHTHDSRPMESNPPDGPTTSIAIDLFGTARNINSYELSNNFFLIDASRTMFSQQNSILPDDPVGAIWTIDLNNTSPVNSDAEYTHVVSTNNAWTNSPEGVSAHYNAGEAYEYFKETFNRESITGTGQNIISFVNVSDEDGSSMGNAFWNGLGIYYGNGDEAFLSLGRALDVAGHEMSHGVVQATANMEYYGEPGALNESFADIFGVMIDRDDWLIGEDVAKSSVFPSGALRSMSDPHNGAPTGDFGRGWQPKHTNEQYLGSDDNGGVHINSGIPNHAFYLLANNIGKAKAEQIYYRALTTYLTRSSGFKELRFAVLQSASDLYGSFEVSEVADAFDAVGITEENQGGFEEELDDNPGQDLLLVSDQTKSNIIIYDLVTGNPVFDPLTDIDQLSKASVTDDGSRIVFVGTDQHIYICDIDWTASPPTSNTFQASYYPEWRNAVISKDGNRIALLDGSLDNTITLLDLPSNSQIRFELTNPTFSEGLETGDVLYADAMEFDVSSSVLMYDAINQISGSNGSTLEYWDIGLLEVWNNDADTWALGRIEKLFGALPEGLSVGNPAFSKNSPSIIALDFIDNGEVSILGVNIETGDVGQIFTNTTLGYPNYSRNDAFLIYDIDFLGNTDLGISTLNSDKITSVINSEGILGPNLRWGVWFGNGERDLTSSEEIINDESILSISPNPAVDFITIELDSDRLSDDIRIEVWDMQGRMLIAKHSDAGALEKYKLNTKSLDSGTYILTIRDKGHMVSSKFVID